MEPIKHIHLEKGPNRTLNMTFKYDNPLQGFDHALIAIVEQDVARDRWTVKPRTVNAAKGLTTTAYAFFNENANKWIDNLGDTSGPMDDVGTRYFFIDLPPHTAKDGTVKLSFKFGYQVDFDNPPSGLEFYAIIAVVAKAAGQPVAVLGNLAMSRLLTQVPA